jgi:hypothetical protein
VFVPRSIANIDSNRDRHARKTLELDKAKKLSTGLLGSRALVDTKECAEGRVAGG